MTIAAAGLAFIFGATSTDTAAASLLLFGSWKRALTSALWKSLAIRRHECATCFGRRENFGRVVRGHDCLIEEPCATRVEELLEAGGWSALVHEVPNRQQPGGGDRGVILRRRRAEVGEKVAQAALHVCEGVAERLLCEIDVSDPEMFAVPEFRSVDIACLELRGKTQI